jgi:hypothetical protein
MEWNSMYTFWWENLETETAWSNWSQMTRQHWLDQEGTGTTDLDWTDVFQDMNL